MVNYIPNVRIPAVNVFQEIQIARGRELVEDVDIKVPPYLLDRRILRAIEQSNLGYLNSYLQQCPRSIERYFFLETVPNIEPVARSIIVSNLLGYAFLFRSTSCIKFLLEMSADPFQLTYFTEWIAIDDARRKIILYEAPAVILLAGSVEERFKPVCKDMLFLLRASGAELHVPITIRKQIFESPKEPSSVSVRFQDTWECLEKEVERKGGDDVVKNKNMLKELKTVYRANKFERL